MTTHPQYPLYPLTASLAAGGWNLKEAIDFQKVNGFEAIDDEIAIEYAFDLGWDGVKLDELLNSWLGEKWAVMTAICRNSSRLQKNGLNKKQALLILDRLDHRGIAGSAELAAALAEACFNADVPQHDVRFIREKAREFLEAWRTECL